MKECRYCGTVYADNLATCPNCGGNKVVSEEEKNESRLLQEKEIENRERAIAEPEIKKKKAASVLVGFLVVLIVVIAFASYRAAQPLSNGMSKEAGEQVYNEGTTYYDAGNYEDAIMCLVQLPSDSKYYKDAQAILAKCEVKYSADVINRANGYITSGEYNIALNLLDTACNLFPENEELSASYNTALSQYKETVRDTALREAKLYAEENDYVQAINTVQSALDVNGQDTELITFLAVYKDAYRSSLIETADAALKDVGYQEAVNIITDGLSVLSNDSELISKIDEYRSYTPVYLSSDDAYSTNKYIKINYFNTDLSTDNYGGTYPSDRIICNCEYGFTEGVGKIEYYLDSKYSKLTGTIYVPDASKSASSLGYTTPSVRIYGDGALLYEKVGLTRKDKPVDFTADISNVEFLSIEIEGGWYRGDGSGQVPLNCVANLAVSK